jgi:hypothetical protein
MVTTPLSIVASRFFLLTGVVHAAAVLVRVL